MSFRILVCHIASNRPITGFSWNLLQSSVFQIHYLDSEIAPQCFERFETLCGNTTYQQSPSLAFSKNVLAKAERDKTRLRNLTFRLQRKLHHPNSSLGYLSRILIAVAFKSETTGRALKQAS